CECLLAQADRSLAAEKIDALLARPLPDLDKAAVQRLKALLQTVRSDYESAISAALSGLALLGVHLSRTPSRADMHASYENVQAALHGRSIPAFGELPVCD